MYLRLKILAISICLMIVSTTSAVAEGTLSYQQTFDANHLAAKQSALSALDGLGLTHDRTIAGSAATILFFSRPATAYSWGESGAVTIHKNNTNRTRVDVTSQKAVRFQITGKSPRVFAREIFDAMSAELALTQ